MNNTHPEVLIREASVTDLEAIVTLERATENAPHWPLSTYAAILTPPTAVAARAEPNPTPLRCLFLAESLASANSNAPTAQHPLLEHFHCYCVLTGSLRVPFFLGKNGVETRGLVNMHSENALGFAVALMPPSPEHIAEIESVAVSHTARRRGIGRALCLAALDWCRACNATSVQLEVRASSAAAIALYTSLGFLRVGHRPHYYANPEDDALILGLTFP